MMQFATFLDTGEGKLLAAALLGAAVGIYWFYKGFRLLQRKRLILNTPASKVRSASMGLVEISGLAIGPYVVVSPLKQAECYYYRSLAYELRQEGKNSKWIKVAEESLHVPFYVDDNTGRVLVDPRGAELDLHCDLKEQYHTSIFFGGEGMTGSVAEFLTRHGVNPDKKIKVEEYCIKPKNFLFVLGTLSQNPGLDASIRPTWAERPGHNQNGNGSGYGTARVVEPVETVAAAPTAPLPDVMPREIIRLSEPTPENVPVTAMTQQQKIAAALMKAGISNPAAWAAAGIGVKPQSPVLTPAPVPAPASVVDIAPRPAPAQKRVAVALQPAPPTAHEPSSEGDGIFMDTAFDLHPPVVLMQGTHSPVFFISWRSQRDVVKSLGWKSALMIWGGPALTCTCVYFLLQHFGWL
jgi:hypothetical protein